MILLIDNYDSFSYNLYQLIGELEPDIRVVRNDQYTPLELEQMNPTHIILSPGPGRPADAGVCEDVVRYFEGKVPILGVCLGHQAICEVYGSGGFLCEASDARQNVGGKARYILSAVCTYGRDRRGGKISFSCRSKGYNPGCP